MVVILDGCVRFKSHRSEYLFLFSSCQDEAMSFDDYLDLYSALSEQATRDVKTAYAFRIYDFDGDGVIGNQV